MYFLSLETSTNNFSLSVSCDERVVRFRNIKSTHILEDSILGAIDKILLSAKIRFEDLDAFAFGLGPGSFTSLRVGLSTLKAFCLATQKPIVGISSLDVIAHGVLTQGVDEICVINDARRGNVYAAMYGSKGRTSDYLLTTIDDVLTKVHGKTLFVGSAVALYQDQIKAGYKKYAQSKKTTCAAIFAEEKYWQPQAKVLAQLAFARLSQKDYDRADTLLPMYLYPQDCQVQGKH